MVTTYNLQTGNVSLGLGGKYTLEDGALLKVNGCTLIRTNLLNSLPLPFPQAKVNNQGQIGLAYSQDLRSGVKLSLSGLIEGRNINAGGHKLGVALDFES